MVERRYIVYPEESVSAHQLMDLYGVDPRECIIVRAGHPEDEQGFELARYTELRVRADGDYRLPVASHDLIAWHILGASGSAPQLSRVHVRRHGTSRTRCGLAIPSVLIPVRNDLEPCVRCYRAAGLSLS